MDDTPKKKPAPKHLDDNYGRYKRSKKHETRLGSRLGGKRLPQSGAKSWSKWDDKTAGGDVSTPDFLFEHKRTVHDSMSVKLDWLFKVSEGARRVLKDPGLIVTFEREGHKPEDWVMIPLDVLERLLRSAK